MLKIDMSKEIFDLLDYYKEFLYPDQDILNLICEDKIKIIPNSWNYVVITNTRLIQDDYFKNLAVEFVQGIANQYVIHFCQKLNLGNIQICTMVIFGGIMRKNTIPSNFDN